VTSSLTNELIRADLNSGKVIDEISLAPEQNPWSVALAGTRAYVSNWVTSSVSVVDLVLGSPIGAIPVGVSPEGLLLDGNRLFVAISGYRRATFDWGPGSVEVIDLAAGAVTDTIPTPLNPQSLARDSAGRIHVLCTGNYGAVTGKVAVIDPVTLEVESEIPLGGSPGGLTIDEHDIAYAGSYFEGVLVYHALNDTPLRDASNPVDVGGFGAGGVLAALGGGSWVAVSGSANLLMRVAPPERAYAIEETVAVGVGPLSLARSFGHAPPPIAAIEAAQSRHALHFRLSASPSSGGLLEARVDLASASPVVLSLFDLAGRRVAELDERPLAAGRTEISWDLGREGISTGRYILRGRAGDHVATRAILFTR
jgi:YVTN family beta-propeller protein